MNNLQKLREVFPNDLKKFVAEVDWMTVPYQSPRLTNAEVFNFYFGDTTKVTADNDFWDQEYKEVKYESTFNRTTDI